MTDSTAEQTYEVVISRYFDAPPAMVYRAFVDPEQLAQWFGPLVFHVPRDTVHVDARPGGRWAMTMVNNDDPKWRAPVNITLVEVVENSLLVGYEDAVGFPGMVDGTRMTLSIEFSPEGDGTRLSLRQGPFPERARMLSQIGWNQALSKLDGLLATPPSFRNAPTS